MVEEPVTYDTDNGHFERKSGQLVWVQKTPSETPIIDSLTTKKRLNRTDPESKGLSELLGQKTL